jgi:stage II sporulation protein AB (anti-sigma F factor)
VALTETVVADQEAQHAQSAAVAAEFRGDVCVLRCLSDGRRLAPDLRDGLERCHDSGVNQVVLDVDACDRLGPEEVRVLADAAERFHRAGGSVVVAVEDSATRARLTSAGVVRPPLPPPAAVRGAAATVVLPDRPHWEHEFQFPATAHGLPVARRRVAAFAEVCGLGEDELFEFTVAVAEALANALVHGSPRGAADEIRVRFYCYSDVVAVEVADAGAGIHATPICVPDGADTSGRGIHFMRALCDAVQFTCDPQGTHVLLLKRRR